MPRMFDATNPAGIPASAGTPDYTMGYTNGAWPTYSAMKAKYPTAVPVAISAIPGASGEALAQGCDGEKGDYSPAQAARFAQVKLATGVVPFTYCSLAAWPDYQHACTAAGVSPVLVDWIVAAYPGNGANLYTGAVGHQWIDHGTYDESVILQGWVPGRAIAPPAPLPPTPPPSGKPTIVPEDLFSMLASDPAFAVRFLYRICFHREADAGGYTTFQEQLAAGKSLDWVMAQMQDSAEGKAAIAAERKLLGL